LAQPKKKKESPKRKMEDKKNFKKKKRRWENGKSFQRSFPARGPGVVLKKADGEKGGGQRRGIDKMERKTGKGVKNSMKKKGCDSEKGAEISMGPGGRGRREKKGRKRILQTNLFTTPWQPDINERVRVGMPVDGPIFCWKGLVVPKPGKKG